MCAASIQLASGERHGCATAISPPRSGRSASGVPIPLNLRQRQCDPAGRRSRTREAIGAIRHVFLDAGLRRAGRAGQDSQPGGSARAFVRAALVAEPGHVFWRVEGSDVAHVEALQKHSLLGSESAHRIHASGAPRRDDRRHGRRRKHRDGRGGERPWIRRAATSSTLIKPTASGRRRRCIGQFASSQTPLADGMTTRRRSPCPACSSLAK